MPASVLALLAARYVRPVGQSSPAPSSDSLTVLVLGSDRFRGDLDLLSSGYGLRFLDLDWNFLGVLLTSFVSQVRMNTPETLPPVGLSARQRFHAAPSASEIGQEREQYRKILRTILPALLDFFDIDAVMTSDLRYRRQSDLCRVASELGYPFILYQRESMFIVPNVFDTAVRRHNLLGQFWGDAVIVQNQITKEMFLTSGNYDVERIHVVGSARMDSFLSRLSEPRAQAGRVISLFSAPNRVSRGPTGDEFREVSHAILRALRVATRLAAKDPEIKLYIKMKDAEVGMRGSEKLSAYRATVVAEAGQIPQNIVFVTDRMAAHDVILSSTVVIALQSTVVLEAAVAGKPVILPHFRFLVEHPEAKRSLMYQESHALFDVPATEAEMERLLLERLADPSVPDEVMSARRELFARHVSPLDGSATSRSAALIRDLAESGRKKRHQDYGHASPSSAVNKSRMTGTLDPR